jgi:hypothetical protein
MYPPASAAPTASEFMPDFIRIDSVHESDEDGEKVLYYINVPGISMPITESWLRHS